MIRVKLKNEEKNKLDRYRGQASSSKSEKALMVLMSNEGNSPVKIAQSLKRHPHTTRKWLKRYQSKGKEGLERKYSNGRPSEKRKKVKQCIHEILGKSPLEFGCHDGLWTVALIVHYIKVCHGLKVSDDTAERALKDMGYSYKRPAKSVSEKAPSKKDKALAAGKIVDDILALTKQKDCEIFALDESHFSNEPYLARGWQKKRWPPASALCNDERACHSVWLLKSQNYQILLEKIQKG